MLFAPTLPFLERYHVLFRYREREFVVWEPLATVADIGSALPMSRRLRWMEQSYARLSIATIHRSS